MSSELASVSSTPAAPSPPHLSLHASRTFRNPHASILQQGTHGSSITASPEQKVGGFEIMVVDYPEETSGVAVPLRQPDGTHNELNEHGHTALMQRAIAGDESGVKALIVAGVDVNEVDDTGVSALAYAAACGHPTITQLLLDAKAAPPVVSKGLAGLMARLSATHHVVVEALLCLKTAVKEGKSPVKSRGVDVKSLLSWAAQQGHADVVKLLIASGVPVNETRDCRWNALLLASLPGYAGVVKVLLAAGAHVDALSSSKWSSLMYSCQYSHVEVVKLLLTAGAFANRRSEDGWTPLHIVALNGCVEVAKLLLTAGAHVNEKRNDGWTAIHIASRHGRVDVVKVLLAAGASVDDRSTDQWTPLLLASLYDHVDVVEVLLSAGVNVHDRTRDEWTALHVAAERGHIDVVKLLLAAGASIDDVTNCGWTALHAAAQNGHTEVLVALLGRFTKT